MTLGQKHSSLLWKQTLNFATNDACIIGPARAPRLCSFSGPSFKLKLVDEFPVERNRGLIHGVSGVLCIAGCDVGWGETSAL